MPVWEEQDFVSQVSAATPYEVGDRGPVVAVVDLGLKTNIVRSLRRRGARVRVLPYTASAELVLAPDVDGVVISPGPGDPGLLDRQVALARRWSPTGGRCWASASATRSWLGRQERERSACASVTTRPTIPCATRSPAG